jgi:hypothetical protein
MYLPVCIPPTATVINPDLTNSCRASQAYGVSDTAKKLTVIEH